MKLGIQTNVWAEELHENDLGHILKEAKEAGYDGFEIGLKRVNGRYKPQQLAKLANEHKLQIVGIHTGAKFSDAAWRKDLEAIGQEAVDYATAVSAPFLLMSGQRSKKKLSKTALTQRADALNTLGRIAQESGISLCFHNHDWEFAHDGEEMAYLVANTDAALVSLMMDVGWVARAGVETAVILRTLAPRTRCYHIKDNTDDNKWIEVGQGIIQWDEIMTDIGKNENCSWVIVERDEPLDDALQSATTSCGFLREQFADLWES